MESELRRKFVVLTLTVIFASGFVAAQTPGGGAGGAPSVTGFLDDIAMGVNDAISWDTGNTWEAMLLNIILPALGIYAVARFVIGKGFHYAEANFQERSSLHSSSDLGDTAEWSARILSAIAAIWAVVAWGAFIAVYWYLAGIVFLIFLVWILITGGIGVMSPFPDWNLPSLSDRGNNSGGEPRSDGGTATAPPGGAIPDELKSEIGSMSEAIGDLESRINQVENEDNQVMEELRQLRSEVEDLEEFEQRIPEMVNQGKLTESQAKEVKKLIDQAETLEQLEEDIEKNNHKILQTEEKVEASEKDIAELENLIAQMEESAEEDLEKIRGELQQLNNENQQIKQELNQLEQQLEQGVVDREVYEEERQKLQEQFKQVKQQIQTVKNQLQEAANERDQIRARIQTLENKMDGTLHIVGDLENRVEELEGEEKQAENLDQEEKNELSNAGSGLPESVRNALVEDVKDADQVLHDEERETKDLEELLKSEEGSLHLEQETGEKEKSIYQRIDKEFIKLAQAAEQLEREVKKETEAFQILDQEEQEHAAVEEKNIREVLKQLKKMARGNTQIPVQEKEQIAENSLQRLDELEQVTQDRQELEMIDRARNYAEQILNSEQLKESEGAKGQKQAEQLAMEAEQISGALPSPEGRQVTQKIERSFETAEQFLDPRNQTSIQQAEGFIWKQQEYLQELEKMKSRQQNPDAVNELERLEKGLIDVLGKICEVKGIDRNQFGFLPG